MEYLRPTGRGIREASEESTCHRVSILNSVAPPSSAGRTRRFLVGAFSSALSRRRFLVGAFSSALSRRRFLVGASAHGRARVTESYLARYRKSTAAPPAAAPAT
jgi:hypothetical protein